MSRTLSTVTARRDAGRARRHRAIARTMKGAAS